MKGFAKFNTTAISAINGTNGFLNTLCKINGTASGAIAVIPFIDKPIFDANPKKFKVGQNFTATCITRVAPASQDYSVNFVKDTKLIGQWTQNSKTI